MTTATHILIHKFRPGTGPQPGTAEYDEEMRQWEEVDQRLRSDGLLVDAFAIAKRGTAVTASGSSPIPTDGEIVFAVHAVSASDEQAAAALVAEMPTVAYGTVEIRPLMS